MLPYGKQTISKADINAVCEVLRSDFLTQGPTVPRFEQELCNFSGAKYSVAVNSATSALHISCLSLGLGPGDTVWTSPNTFVASANCAMYCGANIDFVDINPFTYNIDVKRLEEKLDQARKRNQLPKIVIPVHYAGQPCEMREIYDLSKIYGFNIIEDASHALGAEYHGSKIGACEFSDITIFSFHPVKMITTGEGGLAATNNVGIAGKLSRLRTHGITFDKELMFQRDKDEIWNYQQIELGFNYRMTDIQAALGLSQMKSLPTFVQQRNKIAELYDSGLARIPVIRPFKLPNIHSSYHLYPVRIPSNGGISQGQVYRELQSKGIRANIHYIPVHRHPYYEHLGFKKGQFPEAEQFHREALSLPIYPDLQDSEVEYVVHSLAEIFNI